MWFPFYIAHKYLISKKSYQAVNIISTIATISIAVGTMALVVILSVFNGFDNLIHTLYNKFNPDLLIQPINGKNFTLDTILINKIKKIDGIDNLALTIEDKALVLYNEKQTIVTIKGVTENYNKVSKIESAIIQGNFALYHNNIPCCLVGQGIAYTLDLNISLPLYQQIEIYVPRKISTLNIYFNPEASLNRKFISPSAIFSVEGDIDNQYIIVPFEFANDLFEYNNKLSSIEIKVKNQYKVKTIQRKIKQIIGSNFTVKNRYEQNEVFYKTMKTEKIAIFLILFFILIISTFNVIGTLTMLILEKKEDIFILKSLGVDNYNIQKIFFIEGLLINFIGTITGILTGLIICFLQIKFKLIKLYGSGTFIIDAYPVSIKFTDIILIFFAVILLGVITSYIPSKKIQFLIKENDKK